jgi:filamentous hemagglutinin family protein
LGRNALAVAAAMTVGAWLNPALAGPPDVQVKSVTRGTATFDRSGSTLNIRVSDRAIIDYARFNLGKDSTVRFIQPSASSRVLNRIESRTPSTINGRLQSNGIVYFLNPSGVLFGPNAVIDVGRMYAVGGRISDEDFLQNNNRFQTTGPVVNQGQIAGGEI